MDRMVLPNRDLAMMGLVASLGAPGPALLTARMRNSYWTPSLSPSTVAPVESGPHSLPVTQSSLNFSCNSKWLISKHRCQTVKAGIAILCIRWCNRWWEILRHYRVWSIRCRRDPCPSRPHRRCPVYQVHLIINRITNSVSITAANCCVENNRNSPQGSLARTVFGYTAGSELPILLTAITRNLYSFLLTSCSHLKDKASVVSPTRFHPAAICKHKPFNTRLEIDW